MRKNWPGGNFALRARRGAALIYVMIAMVLYCMLAALAIDMGRARLAKVQLQFAADATARAACQYLSSGVSAVQTQAVAMAAASTVDGSSLVLAPTTDLVFGNWDPTARTFTVQTGSAQANSNAVRVTVTRTSTRGTAIPTTFGAIFGANSTNITAQATAALTGRNGNYSIIGMNNISLTNNSYTDSYNSSNGAYSASGVKHNGSIASNGNISLTGSSIIDGDARAGIGKSTTVGGTAKVTGLNAPLATVMTYPSAVLPSTYTDLGDVNMSSGTVSIPGGTYLLHSLILSGTSHIIWTGPTVLYIRDSYSVTGNTIIDTYQDIPSNRVLNFLPTCTTATWNGTNQCVGDLYAPDTDFTIGGNVEMMGRLLAKSITHSGGGGMHYDEALTPPGGTALKSSIKLVN